MLCEALPLNKYDCQHTGLFHTLEKIADSIDPVMIKLRKVVFVITRRRAFFQNLQSLKCLRILSLGRNLIKSLAGGQNHLSYQFEYGNC